MKTGMHELKREEILALAQQAKLVILDGKISYLNDLATEKELLAFARLLASRNEELRSQTEAASA